MVKVKKHKRSKQKVVYRLLSMNLDNALYDSQGNLELYEIGKSNSLTKIKRMQKKYGGKITKKKV